MWVGRIHSISCLPLFLSAALIHAELFELKDQQLASFRGQAVIENDQKNQAQLLAVPFGDDPQLNALTSMIAAQKNSAGITMDIYLDMHIAEIRWVDADGGGPNGTQGSVSLSNVYIGGRSASSSNQALIKGVTFDVSGTHGIKLGVQKIGGPR